MKRTTRMVRATAATLSLILVQAAFGSAAWAQVRIVAETPVPLGGVATGPHISAGAGTFAGPASLSVSLAAAPTISAPALSASSALSAAAIEAAPNAAAASAAATPAAAPVAAATIVASDGATTSLDASAPRAAAGNGPRAAAIGGRVAQRFGELKAFFAGRSAGAVATLSAAAEDAPSETPTPAQSAAAAPALAPSTDAAGTRKMMGRYIVASNMSQAGYEGLASASLPVYLDQTFHKISLMADLSILGTFSSIVGRQLSPLIVNGLPLKKAYIGTLAATFVTALAIGTLANVHLLTIVPLYGLMVLFRLTQAAASTAERAVIPSVLGKDQVAMEGLRGRKQSWAEVASVLTQNGAAALVVVLGTATTNMIIAPWFYLAAIGILFATLRIPKAADDARLAGWREKSASTGGALAKIKGAFANFVKQISQGYKVVMNDPALRASAVVSALMILFNVAVYSILAPTFGKFAIGPGADSSLAAPIMGLIAGLFSFGGLFAGKLVNKHAHDVEAKFGADGAGAEEAARSSTMRWLKYGALSFLAVGAMALPLPAIAPLIALGSHASLVVTAVLGTGTILSMWKPKLGLALALAPVLLAFPAHVALAAVAFFGFGLLQVVAGLKNDSLFDKLVQEKAPADYANAAAFVGAASMFAGVLGLIVLKFLIYGSLPFGIPSPLPAFVGLPGIWPFVAIFAGLAVPAMLAMLYFSGRLDKLTAPKK